VFPEVFVVWPIGVTPEAELGGSLFEFKVSVGIEGWDGFGGFAM